MFIAIPLILATIIPFFITKNKDNSSPRWTISLTIHLAIIACVSLSVAGLTHTTVMTRTKVYVLADVSYSSSRNFDEIDKQIQEIYSDLPSNSKMGIVCFGNDIDVITSSGESIRSVKEAKVDASGTNIAQALDEVSTFFSVGEIKRIVLITDGADTTTEGKAAAAVERAIAKGIKVDAIYLDNNLKDGEVEVQISNVTYTGATYLNHDSSAELTIESSAKTDALVTLFVKQGEQEYSQIDTRVTSLDDGTNTLTLELPTNNSGVFDYKVEILATDDRSPYNNEYIFTQTVTGLANVLLITGNEQDAQTFTQLYSSSASLKTCLITSTNKSIPYTVEELSQYDEIIVSNVDIREIENINAFIDSADIVISQYGKSLITFGDLHMQNTDDEVFARFEELLPVSFGNANKDSRLYTIVMDISRSMYYSRPAQLIVAKDAATKLISILEDEDYVSFIAFSGEAKVELAPTKLGECREQLYQMIQGVTASQGTFIGEALSLAHDLVKDLTFEQKQIMLISDGKTYTNEPENAEVVAQKLKDDDIVLSTVAVLNHSPQIECVKGCHFLSNLASVGGGVFYELLYQEKVAELVFATIGDTVTDAIVTGQSNVNIQTYHDDALEGIISIPQINGYVNSKAKPDATTVLSVDYRKNSSKVVQVPLYSYRDHGNGRVATFTSNVQGEWIDGWSQKLKGEFFSNVLKTNTPTERIDYPFEIKFEHLGETSTVEIAPSYLNPKAKAQIKITYPDASVSEQSLVFNLNHYKAVFDTSKVGKYHIEITYTYGTNTFESSTYYTLSYAQEYDAFTAYDVASVYDIMRGNGKVITNGNLSLENDEGDVATYERNFAIPLLIVAVILFVIDVFIRKFSKEEIKAFFNNLKTKKLNKEDKK